MILLHFRPEVILHGAPRAQDMPSTHVPMKNDSNISSSTNAVSQSEVSCAKKIFGVQEQIINHLNFYVFYFIF